MCHCFPELPALHEQIGVHCVFKNALPSNLEPEGFEQYQLGYCYFDLLARIHRWDGAVPVERRVETGQQ